VSVNKEVEPQAHESTLYCSAEYHLVALGSVTAMGIYGLALRVAQKTGRFRASTRTLSNYFSVRQQTIVDAMQLLCENGWFEILTADPGKPVVYVPIIHSDWAEKHSGQCVEKLEMPWDAEKKDELGPVLFAHTDGRYKIWPNILKGLRNTRHSDKAIEYHVTQFWKIDSRKKGVWSRFKQYLEAQPVRQEAA